MNADTVAIKLLQKTYPRLGMGCWAVGGALNAGKISVGWHRGDDAEACATIAAAYEAGIRVFDTAAAYGAGHSERLLGQVLKDKDDVFISTKFGVAFDEAAKQVLGEETSVESLDAAVDASRRRMQRDHLDLMFCHLNTGDIDQMLRLFDRLDDHVAAGRVQSYGWSTDFPDRAEAVGSRANCIAIQHAMNVFFDAPSQSAVIEKHGLASFNRGPLAMGLLTGKFSADTQLPDNDIRSNDMDWLDYFKGGRPSPSLLAKIDAVGELLRSDGRSLGQGALAWLWAKNPRTLPIPGAKTVAQAQENAQALGFGPLSPHVMAEIETLIGRPEEGEPRER